MKKALGREGGRNSFGSDFEKFRDMRSIDFEHFKQHIRYRAVDVHQFILVHEFDDLRCPRIVEQKHVEIDIGKMSLLEEVECLIRLRVFFEFERVLYQLELGHNELPIENFDLVVGHCFDVRIDDAVAEISEEFIGQRLHREFESILDALDPISHYARMRLHVNVGEVRHSVCMIAEEDRIDSRSFFPPYICSF